MSRLPPISPDALEPAQRRVYDAVLAGPRKSVPGPILAWLRSPGLADPAQALGAFLRFESSLPARLRELAILLTARATTAQFEWFMHRPIAEQAGLKPALIEAIAARRELHFDDADQALTCELATALARTSTLDAALYARGLQRFGERGLVEFVALVGYYTMVAMTLNAFAVALPEGVKPPLPP